MDEQHGAELLLEVYNTSDAEVGSSLSGFDAEKICVLRVKLSDVWGSNCHTPSGCGDMRRGSSAQATRLATSMPSADRWTRPVNGDAETYCHKDQWFDGVVSPSPSHRDGTSSDVQDIDGFIVEARLEFAWSGPGSQW